jgi:hypothetical protein
VAFGGVYNDTVIAQALEHLSYVVLVFLRTCASNQKVIYVGITKMQAPQDLIDEPLKGLCRIPETERHSKKLE